MAAPLPITRGTSVPLYPFSRIIRTATRVAAFENAYEKRAVVRPALVDFVLPFDHLSPSQTQALRGAHTSAKGQLDTTLSLQLGAISFSNLTLMDDAFESTEYLNRIYRAEVRLRQTVPQLLTADPNLVAGVPTFPAALGQYPHLPYSRATHSKTYLGDQETGPRYGFGLYGTGLTGFPINQPKSWRIQADTMTDEHRDTLESFFLAMNGWYGEFSYTDSEDGVTYTKCCFAQHDLSIQYEAMNINRVSIAIEEKPN